MEHIDTALEKRVWQRVYGKGSTIAEESAPLEQLCCTARDCAELYRSLRQESKGAYVQRFAGMEREMDQAARRLASLMDVQGQLPAPVGCPGCSRRRKLELLRLWLQDWSGRCREYSRDTRCGKLLGELARLGDRHARSLRNLR